MPGPAPKPAGQRARRNKDTVATTILPNPGIAVQPPLPEGIDWHPLTIQWWDAWRTSPQAEAGLITAADWQFMLVTARIHTEFWTNGTIAAAGELRQRETKFGVTIEDRAKLRLTFAEGDLKENALARQKELTGSRARRAISEVIDVTPVVEDEPDAVDS